MKKNIDKSKIIIGLSALLVFQVLLILSLNYFSFQNKKTRSYGKILLKNFKKENVTSIEVSDFQDTFLIEKRENKWLVKVKDKYIPGNDTIINGYLESVQNLSQGVIRDKGNNPDSDKFYGFDNENYQKITIKTKNNKKDFIIYIGNTGSRSSTSYIKLDNEKKIREIESNISSETGNKPVLWAEKMILKDVVIEDVERCDIRSNLPWFIGNYSIQFKEQKEKDKDSFILIPEIKDKKIKEYSLSNIIINLIQINIDEYKLNGNLTNENIESASIKLTLKNGKIYNISLYKSGKNDTGDYILKIDTNNYLYLVDENDVKRFIKSTDELIEK